MKTKYQPHENSRLSYAAAISAMREKYLAKRKEGESATEWVERRNAETKG